MGRTLERPKVVENAAENAQLGGIKTSRWHLFALNNRNLLALGRKRHSAQWDPAYSKISVYCLHFYTLNYAYAFSLDGLLGGWLQQCQR